MEIWSNVITSEIPIHIFVNWVELDENILGSARPSSREANFEGAPNAKVWYPIALAERLARKELNDSTEFEINISFNSERQWSYSLDATLDSLRHDFLSVALHEIGHGLGLSDTFSVSGSNGSWGFDLIPNLYDTYITNLSGKQLIDVDNFPNNSTNLKNQITSGQLLFKSNIAKEHNDGKYPRIYAPGTFNGGSSISHLNEITYPAGDANSLMTPQLSRGEIVQGLGEIVPNMLAEMGYVWTFIDHDTIQNPQNINEDVVLNALVESDSAIIENQMWVYYSFDEFETEIKMPLEKTIGENQYSAIIPAPGIPATVNYYFSVKDVTQREYTSPLNPLDTTYQLVFGLQTSINGEEFEIDYFNIFPNPAMNEFRIIADFMKPVEGYEIAILNSMGQNVYQFSTGVIISGMDKIIRLDEVPGLYIIQLKTPSGVMRTRLFLK